MALDRSGTVRRQDIGTLTKNDLDRKIERLIDEVAGLPEKRESCSDSRQPRWIAPADLVRRLRQFIVYN